MASAALTVWAGLVVAVLAVVLPAAAAPAVVLPAAAAPAPAGPAAAVSVRAPASVQAPASAPAPASGSGPVRPGDPGPVLAPAVLSGGGGPACAPGAADHGGLPAVPARAGGEHAHVPPARPVPEGARAYAAMPVRVLVRGPDRPAPGPVELSVMRV
ncbi:hypothetical protein [Streptomyces sp. NBC_00105]|uniref:hypothetical protein n=1 Tax=Streptomyces sp. NBC_00105 TaxID=2903622 RepID=UPI00324A167B